MRTAATARVLTVDDAPIVRADLRLIPERDEAQERGLRIMVEAMLSAGRTEREITRAVARARGDRSI